MSDKRNWFVTRNTELAREIHTLLVTARVDGFNFISEKVYAFPLSVIHYKFYIFFGNYRRIIVFIDPTYNEFVLLKMIVHLVSV